MGLWSCGYNIHRGASSTPSWSKLATQLYNDMLSAVVAEERGRQTPDGAYGAL